MKKEIKRSAQIMDKYGGRVKNRADCVRRKEDFFFSCLFKRKESIRKGGWKRRKRGKEKGRKREGKGRKGKLDKAKKDEGREGKGREGERKGRGEKNED